MKIFCANNGRSGSLFLSEVFKEFTDIPSFHEPYPRGIGKTMEEVNTIQVSEKTKMVLEAKREIIGAYDPYIETSQTFIKTFVDDFFNNTSWDIGCIYLERNPLDMLRSYANSFASSKAEEWFLDPSWQNNFVDGIEYNLSWYERVLYNWFEVKARFHYWLSNCRWSYGLKFEDLNSPEVFEEIFDQLGIPHAAVTKEGLNKLRRNASAVVNRHPGTFLKDGERDTAEELIRKDWKIPAQNAGFVTDYDWLINNYEGSKK